MSTTDVATAAITLTEDELDPNITLARFPTAADELAALRGGFASYAGRFGPKAAQEASGLAMDLPARLLDQEFGRGKVMRFEDIDFPVTLTHEPTRRFLRETGLPEDGTLFSLDFCLDMDVPLPTLAESCADSRANGLPDRADHLIRLGHLVEGNSLVLDGETGAVLHWSRPEAALYPLTTDVSTLAFTLWLLHRES